MKTHEATGRAPVRGTLFALILAMTGCTQAPDLKVVQAERAKPVLRFDTFQSAASNGKVLFTFQDTNTNSKFQGAATIVNGVLYQGNNDGMLYAFGM